MNQSELEKLLRAEAREMNLSCPDTPRQHVLRTLRTEPVPPRSRLALSSWRPLAAALVLVLVIAGVLQYQPRPKEAGEAATVVEQPARPALELPAVSGDLIDRAMAEREASLEAELERIQADLERIKSLVKNV